MSESVTIERMSYGPDAVGRLSCGKTVFVRGAVPGETVEVDIVEEKPRYARAVLAAGRPDDCSEGHSAGCSKGCAEGHSEKRSGGRSAGHPEPGGQSGPVLSDARSLQAVAPWAHLPYDLQLSQKQSIVRDALVRVAHLEPDEADAVVRPIVRSKDEWGYRNKLELAVTTDERGRFALGFHDDGAASVAPVRDCPLGNRLTRRAPGAVAGALRYLAGDVDLGVYRVGVRGSLGTNSVEVALWTPPSAFPRAFAAKMLVDAVGATSVVRVVAEPGASRRVKRVEVLDGDGHWRENMVLPAGSSIAGSLPGGCAEYAVSAPSFFQVNTKQAARLVSLALEALDVQSGDAACDLYAGVGTFSIPLALAGADVAAVELEGSAARDLRRNCKRAGVDVDVVCDDVGRALPSLVKRHGGLDAVIVDPPRSGLDKRALGHVADAAPKRIVYISCDPQTMARDAARLAARGFRLVSTTPVDLFPQTYHVETVNLFARA